MHIVARRIKSGKGVGVGRNRSHHRASYLAYPSTLSFAR